MELTNINRLGISKGTHDGEVVSANFRGETHEVGLYLAMVRQAQREGYPEIAEALKRIAGRRLTRQPDILNLMVLSLKVQELFS